MQAAIPEADIQQASISSINVGQVGIGPIQIGQLVVNNLGVDMAVANAHLRNFRVTLALALSLDWSVQVDLGFTSFGDSGTVNIGNPSFTIGLGDVNVPGLQDFRLNLASLTVNNLAASASPVTNLQLHGAVAQQIKASNVKLPTPPFSIAGAAIGSLQAAGIAVPGATVDQVTIGRVQGSAFPLGQMVLANLALPRTSVSDIVSQGVDVTATPIGRAFHMDLGILDLTLKVQPSAHAQIDQLTISGVTASTSVGRLEMNNIVAPYEFLNITLGQVGIQSIDIPSFSLS